MQLANLYVLYVILSHFDEAKDEDPICLLKEAGAWLGIYVLIMYHLDIFIYFG